MSCCTIFKMHDVHSVCFVKNDLRSLTIPCIVYTCATNVFMCIKHGFHLKFNSGQFSGQPTELYMNYILIWKVLAALFAWQNSHGQLTPLPTELPTVSIYGSSGQPNLHGKIPMVSPLRPPLSCPLFHILKAVGCQLSCPLRPNVSIYVSSGKPNLHGKILIGSPRAAHSIAQGQRSGLLPCFFLYGLPYNFNIL